MARIHYRDSAQPLTGRIFLPETAERHEGRMGVDEWMNRPGHFFPFAVDGEETPRILNKHHVMVMTVQAEAEIEKETMGVQRAVVVQCGALRLDGTVSVELPEEHSRTLDWANAPEPFLVLRNAEGLHIVQKDCISSIADRPEE